MGNLVEQDERKAEKLWQQAAAQGNAKAELQLGQLQKLHYRAGFLYDKAAECCASSCVYLTRSPDVNTHLRRRGMQSASTIWCPYKGEADVHQLEERTLL